MTKEDYLLKILQTQRNKPKKLQTGKASKYPQGYFKEKKCRHCGFYLCQRLLVNITVVIFVKTMV